MSYDDGFERPGPGRGYGGDWFAGRPRGARGGRGWGRVWMERGALGPPGPPGPWRARRMRRGDVPALLLAGLLDGPAHGYELIRRLEERSHGWWRPSAGSVYPTLQMLEEQGLVTSRDEAGKRIYELTEAGRPEAERAAAYQPWGDEDGGGGRELGGALRQLVLAVRQVVVGGEPAQIEAATAVVVEARQRLYRMLAGE